MKLKYVFIMLAAYNNIYITNYLSQKTVGELIFKNYELINITIKL